MRYEPLSQSLHMSGGIVQTQNLLDAFSASIPLDERVFIVTPKGVLRLARCHASATREGL